MFKVEFDYSQLEKVAQDLGAAIDQIPFSLALAMNEAADVTRKFLITQTWPQHVNARNSSFIAASLTTKDAKANKYSLAVEIYDRLNRGHLEMQARGGTRTPIDGSNLAIPLSTIPKGARGVPARLRPRTMGTKAFKMGDGLYTRDKKGKLKLLYILRSSTAVPKRVPFYEDFATSMSRELQHSLPKAIARAMSTRR